MALEPRDEVAGYAAEEGGRAEGPPHLPPADLTQKRETALLEDQLHLGPSVQGQEHLCDPGLGDPGEGLLQLW